MDNTAVESVERLLQALDLFETQDTARSPHILNMGIVLWLPDQKHYELD